MRAQATAPSQPACPAPTTTTSNCSVNCKTSILMESFPPTDWQWVDNGCKHNGCGFSSGAHTKAVRLQAGLGLGDDVDRSCRPRYRRGAHRISCRIQLYCFG